jgi:Protein of unknown function (DUF4199)
MAILDNPQEDSNAVNVSFMPTAQKWGLYFGAAFIIYTILMSMVSLDFEKPMSLVIYGLSVFVVLTAMFIGFGIATIREHRTSLGGFIDFKTAFMVCLAVFSVGVVIYSSFSFVYYNYINTSYMENMKESMVGMYDKYDVPDAQRADGLKAIEDGKTILGTAISSLKLIAGSAVLAAIMAAIMKKERPMFG